MLRRNVRLRKEYLYKKSLEEKENLVRARKLRIRDAFDAGKPIAPEDRDFELEKRTKLDLEDAQSLKPVSIVDDEYAFAGVKDPKILLTTARDPSSRLLQFVKELNLLFPNAHRINRGAYVVNDLVRLCQTNDVTDMIVVHEHRGIPDGLIISHMPLGPTVYFGLSDVVLRHDLPKKPPPMSTVAPHLVFDNFTSKLGQRIMTVLKFLFPPAAPLGQRVMSFVNQDDKIHFRHHIWVDERHPSHKNQDAGASTSNTAEEDAVQSEDRAALIARQQEKTLQGIVLREVGPRFVLKPYRIELGTLDMPDLEVEWSLKPFLNKPRPALVGV